MKSLIKEEKKLNPLYPEKKKIKKQLKMLKKMNYKNHSKKI